MRCIECGRGFSSYAPFIRQPAARTPQPKTATQNPYMLMTGMLITNSEMIDRTTSESEARKTTCVGAPRCGMAIPQLPTAGQFRLVIQADSAAMSESRHSAQCNTG